MINAPNNTELTLSNIYEIALLKWKNIALITSIFAIVSISSSLLIKPIYEADALLVQVIETDSSMSMGGLEAIMGAGSLGSMLGNMNEDNGLDMGMGILYSRKFIVNFVEENKLQPILFKDSWDVEKNTWKDENEIPDAYVITKTFTKWFYIKKEEVSKGYRLRVRWYDPTTPVKWANLLVNRLNYEMKIMDQSELELQIDILQGLSSQYSLNSIQKSIFSIIEKKIEQLAMTKSRDDYLFKIIDPPVVQPKKVYPARSLIVIFSTLFGFLFSLAYSVYRSREQ